jgi:hypothetical protein
VSTTTVWPAVRCSNFLFIVSPDEIAAPVVPVIYEVEAAARLLIRLGPISQR